MAFDFPSSPTTGQTYSVTGGPTYVYNGTAWVVLTPGNQFNRTVFTATAGQTTFTMNYVVGAVDVYRNGVKLAPADFTATNGTSIVLLNAATVGDTIEVISYPMITYSDAVKRTGDTMTGALAVPSLTVNSVPVLAGPAFSVWRSGSQSIAGATYTKIQFNAEEYDTANCFDSTTNFRFTPNVAGYYQINATWQAAGAIGAAGQTGILIYKNGSFFKWGMLAGLSSSENYSAVVSSLVYCNGTTDYIEIYAYIGNANTISGSQTDTYANGFLARAA